MVSKRTKILIFGKLADTELETNELHLNLTKSSLYCELINFQDEFSETIEKKMEKKQGKLNNKLRE